MVTMSAVLWLSAAALIFVIVHVPSSVLSQTDRECTWVSVIHYMPRIVSSYVVDNMSSSVKTCCTRAISKGAGTRTETYQFSRI